MSRLARWLSWPGSFIGQTNNTTGVAIAPRILLDPTMCSTRHHVLEGRRSGARANYMSCDSRPRPTSSSALTSTGVIGSISSSAAPPNPSKSSSACVTPGFAPTRQHARCQSNCIRPAARTHGQRPTSQDVPSISGKVGLRRTTRRRDRSGIKGCLARPPEGVESPNQSSPCRAIVRTGR